VQITLNPELLAAADMPELEPSVSVSRLLALELFRERRVSAGRAAELARTPLEEFLNFAARREVALNYTSADLNKDRETAGMLRL
jgi:predicted HTH domain antitoxin